MKVSAPTAGRWGGTWTGYKLCGVCCVGFCFLGVFSGNVCFFMFNGNFFLYGSYLEVSQKRGKM